VYRSFQKIVRVALLGGTPEILVASGLLLRFSRERDVERGATLVYSLSSVEGVQLNLVVSSALFYLNCKRSIAQMTSILSVFLMYDQIAKGKTFPG